MIPVTDQLHIFWCTNLSWYNGGWELIHSYRAGTFVYSIEHRLRNRRRTLWTACFLLVTPSFVQVLKWIDLHYHIQLVLRYIWTLVCFCHHSLQVIHIIDLIILINTFVLFTMGIAAPRQSLWDWFGVRVALVLKMTLWGHPFWVCNFDIAENRIFVEYQYCKYVHITTQVI